MIYIHSLLVRMARSLPNPGTWVTELMQALEVPKLRMEAYANLVHKSSERAF